MANDNVDSTKLYRRRQLVGMLYALKSIKRGKFKLSSGKESEHYFDGRLAALDPETLNLMVPQIAEIVSEYTFDSIGCMEGPGSVSILGALLLGYGLRRTNKPITGFVIRKQAKAHGTEKLLEGYCGSNPIIIDDVATSGNSIIHAVENMPHKPTVAVVLLDRGEGATEMLKTRGIELRSVLTMADLTL